MPEKENMLEPIPLIRTLSEHHWEVGKILLNQLNRNEGMVGETFTDGMREWYYILRRDSNSNSYYRETYHNGILLCKTINV